jgi:hypothetical protein
MSDATRFEARCLGDISCLCGFLVLLDQLGDDVPMVKHPGPLIAEERHFALPALLSQAADGEHAQGVRIKLGGEF